MQAALIPNVAKDWPTKLIQCFELFGIITISLFDCVLIQSDNARVVIIVVNKIGIFPSYSFSCRLKFFSFFLWYPEIHQPALRTQLWNCGPGRTLQSLGGWKHYSDHMGANHGPDHPTNPTIVIGVGDIILHLLVCSTIILSKHINHSLT